MAAWSRPGEPGWPMAVSAQSSAAGRGHVRADRWGAKPSALRFQIVGQWRMNGPPSPSVHRGSTGTGRGREPEPKVEVTRRVTSPITGVVSCSGGPDSRTSRRGECLTEKSIHFVASDTVARVAVIRPLSRWTAAPYACCRFFIDVDALSRYWWGISLGCSTPPVVRAARQADAGQPVRRRPVGA